MVKNCQHALKMPYEQIHACLKGCILFMKEHKEAKYHLKCKSSRFLEVDSGEGQNKKLGIHENPMVPSIHIKDQRLYVTKESTRQMTWHKNCK